MAQEPVTLQHSEYAKEWAESSERVPVFTVVKNTGEVDELGNAKVERKTYTCPAKPHAGLALQYLREARKNMAFAASWLIETGIGTEGYDALVEEMAGLAPTEAQGLLKSIATRIEEVVLGGLEGPKA